MQRAMHIFLSGLLPGLLLVACGTPRTRIETGQKGRIIALTDSILTTGGTDTVRFGHLHPGEIGVQQLWLANETSHPVALLYYRSSCGCTTLEYDAEPLKPGETGILTLSFNTRGEWGWQLRTVDLQLSGAQRPLRLYVEARVE